MKLKIKILCLLIGITLQPAFLQAQNGEKPVKILLIGNSFSQNATRYLPQMAKEAHIKLVLGRAEMGGCSLQRHWDSVVVNNADSTRGRAYNGKSLRQLLASQKWDVVTLQQYSKLSGNMETYQPYANKLFELIKTYQPNARIMVHQTWAYRADAVNLGDIGANKKATNADEMWRKSRAAYRRLARDLGGLSIIPSGDAFQMVSTDATWGFKKDTQFDASGATQPALPNDKNSLNVGYHWTDKGKLNFDPNHASEAGCYLSGMVWYRFVLNQNPLNLKFRPPVVEESFAGFLKATASKVSDELQN